MFFSFFHCHHLFSTSFDPSCHVNSPHETLKHGLNQRHWRLPVCSPGPNRLPCLLFPLLRSRHRKKIDNIIASPRSMPPPLTTGASRPSSVLCFSGSGRRPHRLPFHPFSLLQRCHTKRINSKLICHHCRPLPFPEWPPPTSSLVQKALPASTSPHLNFSHHYLSSSTVHPPHWCARVLHRRHSLPLAKIHWSSAQILCRWAPPRSPHPSHALVVKISAGPQIMGELRHPFHGQPTVDHCTLGPWHDEPGSPNIICKKQIRGNFS
jgi:hypothetical protein